MPDAEKVTTTSDNAVYLTAAAAISIGEVRQLANGQAGAYAGRSAATADTQVKFEDEGTFVVTKTSGIVLLDGGEVWWDYSANSATYRRNGDRDFYLGTAVGDAASADVTCSVKLNRRPHYAIDLAVNGFTTAIVGTQALGGLALNARGGALNAVLNATNEAQKVDALSLESFANGANGIVEFKFNVVSDGGGTVVDVSIGIASATHATDASSIAQRLFMHLDANDADINFESADGTTTVAITDSTINYTEGTPVTVWFDMRDPANVAVYVDAVRVLSGTVFNVNAAASEWKLLAHVEKTSSTDTYELDLYYARVRTAEQ